MAYTLNPFTGALDYYVPATPPSGSGNSNFQDSFLVSGGQVVWISGYQFSVSAAVYYINGVQYTSTEQTVTLTAADATLDRIDTIVVDNTGTATKVTGTAAASPSEPNIDPSSQLKLAIVSVPHNTTAPPTVSTTLVYDENVGSPTEWNATTSGSGFNVASTNNPHAGTKDTEGTAVTSGSYVQYQIGSGTFDPSTSTLFYFYLRSKATWSSNRGLQIGFYNAGVLVGSVVKINPTGSFGFNSASTSGYQLVAIPIQQFAIPIGTVFTQVRFIDFGGSIGFYLDTINFQGGAVTTTNQYAPIASAFVTVGNDSTLTGERALTGTSNVIVLTDNGPNSTLVINVGTNVVQLTSTQTLTNKRVTPRVVTAADATSITPNTDNADMTYQSNSQATGTLTINADGGTPTNGQFWMLKIKSTNVQTFSWNGGFVGGTIALPTATSGGGKIDYYSFIYDTVNSKWDYTGTATNF